MGILLGLTVLSLIIWLVLVLAWGQFWRCDQRLEAAEEVDQENAVFPAVCAIVPARNEADVLPLSLRSLLTQDYPGNLTVLLIDDQSTDGTGAIAQQTAQALGKTQQLIVLSGEPLPAGWSGKLWAMHQGVQKAQTLLPDYILLTDADIEHDVSNLRRLVNKALKQELDMASVMVRLRCDSFWEKLLIPAFVFFFMKLYPFPWINDPKRKTAGAAGGCILLRREALERIGGLESIRQALIDDCSLAEQVKLAVDGKLSKQPVAKIWLGLSELTRSLRPYETLDTIWNMVARTAYTQLGYNPLLLVCTLFGMGLVYLLPPIALVVGIVTGQWAIALSGLIAYGLMTVAYFPTVRFYECSPVFALCLPAIALLYTLMTLDSALRHWQGRGGAWKGRVYEISDRGSSLTPDI